jgi:hypothetical protein
MDTVPSLVRRLSLQQPASAWADAVFEAAEAARGVSQPEALARMESSSFDIRTNVKELESLYAV